MCQHLAVDQHGDAVGQLEDGVHIVLNQQDGHAGVARAQFGNQGCHFGRFFGPHASQGFVQQQQLGVCGQSQCHIQLALCPVGQAACGALPVGLQLHALGQLPGFGFQIGIFVAQLEPAKAVAVVSLHGQKQVLRHAELGEDARNLEAARQACRHTLVGGQANEFGAIQLERAAIRSQQARN